MCATGAGNLFHLLNPKACMAGYNSFGAGATYDGAGTAYGAGAWTNGCCTGWIYLGSWIFAGYTSLFPCEGRKEGKNPRPEKILMIQWNRVMPLIHST